MTTWKPTLYTPLAVQEAPRVQTALFVSPAPRTESPCEHAGDRQRQERIDGGTDDLCCACGEKTQVARAKNIAENEHFRQCCSNGHYDVRGGMDMKLRLARTEKSAKSERQPPRRTRNADARSREYLTSDEVRRLRERARKTGRYGFRDSLIIATMFRHGLRIAELVTLTWDDLLLDQGKMNVRRVKNGTPSVHFLGGNEIRELRRLQHESQPSRFVFCSERGGPLSVRAVHNLVQRAGEVAGFTFTTHPHQLRHARGFLLANRGEDTRAIQAFMGHADIRSTTIYTALSPTRFKGFEADD